MLWKSFVLAIVLVLFVFATSCASMNNAAQSVSPTRAACAPRPTRSAETIAAFTRDPRPKSPTPAPSQTPGPPPTSGIVRYPTLEQPLVNEKLVLEKLYAMEVDTSTVWENPGCVETLELEPGRIRMKRYNTENEYEAIFGGGGRYGDMEPVWVVTILGKVNPPPMPEFGTDHDYAYITYIIGEKTGMVNGIRLGQSTKALTIIPVPTSPPRTRKPRTPKLRTPFPTPDLNRGTETPVLTGIP